MREAVYDYALWQTSGGRARLDEYLAEMQRASQERVREAHANMTRLLAEQQARPEPIPEVVDAYEKMIVKLEAHLSD